jgi:probable HAF family extracellular repeat protein
MTDIGSLNDQLDDWTHALDINNEGQVVGYSDSKDGPYHAFRWSNGTMTDLGTLGGNYSEAYAINKAGDVVGTADITKSSRDQHAFLWSNASGTMTDLGTLTGDDEYIYATDINNAGRVIGYTNNDAFTWYKGTMTDLNTLLPENSGWKIIRVYAINNHGQIAGLGTFDGGDTYTAVLLTPVWVTN